MNISKKAIMSFIVALTSVVSMAQPYYHIMKEVNGKLIEDTVYNGKDYNIKIDMVNEPKPEDAIGNKITIEGYDCHDSYYKRSFYFTNKGNVYYSSGHLDFEKSQLDYSHNSNHIGLFRWGRNMNECLGKSFRLYWSCRNDVWGEQEFYFANPKHISSIQGYTRNWALLSACEWRYVCEKLGECGWKVDGKICYLIDTTPGKSLLRTIESKNGGKTMSKEDFEYYEAKGLVGLPATGLARNYNNTYYHGNYGCYWSCTPSRNSIEHAWLLFFSSNNADVLGDFRSESYALRLVLLAN